MALAPSTFRSQFRGLLWLCLAMIVGLTQAAPAPTAGVGTAKLKLRWEVLANGLTDSVGDGRAKAALTLTNTGGQAIPATGWSIYFSAIAGVDTGSVLEGHARLERVSGTLFVLRPTAGAVAIAPGQTQRWVFMHPEVMIMPAKAPQAPYFVLDATPDVAQRITDYRLELLTRPEQLELGKNDSQPLVTPQALFDRYAAIADVPEKDLPPVFPTPRQFEKVGGNLVWAALPQVVADRSLAAENALAHRILSRYFLSTTKSERHAHKAASTLRLRVARLDGEASTEAYRLVVDSSGVTITGSTAAGVSRGLQSLRDLLPVQVQAGQALTLPQVVLVDAPRFEYRGIQLDVSRNFQSKASVLKWIDLMARYKLNKLHLHLIDDEGWRVAIAGLPELTQFGARRGHPADLQQHLPSAYGSGPDLADPHGSGFYSEVDYVAIVRYAAQRHIEVIPEIEMPGHARAAVKAMEYRTRQLEKAGNQHARQYLLSDPLDESQYRSPQLYTDHVINPGMPSTYSFIDKVVGEFARMHKKAGSPLRNLHVGGDELPRGAWQKSPASQALMKQLNLATTGDLWNYFYDRVDQILRRHGVVASGWEELGARNVQVGKDLRAMPNPAFVGRGFTVYVWNNLDDSADLAYRLANAGYQTVLAPVTNLYFDMAHLKHPQEHGHNWGAYVDLDTVFDFVPFDFTRQSPTDATPVKGLEALSAQGKAHIRGIEATLFSETMREPEQVEFMLMPRLLGLAERAWVSDPAWSRESDRTVAKRLHDADWSVFVNMVGKRVLPRLDAEGAGVAYRIAPPGLRVEQGKVWVNQQLPSFTLRYTTDGTPPGRSSPQLMGPIEARGQIQVAAFDRSGRSSRVSSVTNP